MSYAAPMFSTQDHEFDVYCAKLRALYFAGSPLDPLELAPEVLVHWRRVAKIQRASGASPERFVEAQLAWFADYGIDPTAPQAVESLVSEWSLKRVRAINNNLQTEGSQIRSVPEEEAEYARRAFEAYREHYFSSDNRIYNHKSDVWKRLVFFSKKSHESLDKFILASFVYAVENNKAAPTPFSIASAVGLLRSTEVNKTINPGPQIKTMDERRKEAQT